MQILDPAILPNDGRFGSGPSKIRPAQINVLTSAPLGTSHRQAPVKNIVQNIKDKLRELFVLPAEYEIILGNGGATALWDAIPFNLIENNAQCAVIGEFSGKAAQAVANFPWISNTEILEVPAGKMITNRNCDQVDTYLYAHNETSTGITSPIKRYGNANALNIVDGTSIAGAHVFNPKDVDFYYFSPQKCFAADGGLWIAFASPQAVSRIEKMAETRWIPAFLNLKIALENSRKNQTYNTPAIATLVMLEQQIQWLLELGGMQAAATKSARSAKYIYDWAEHHAQTQPFIKEVTYRSPVVTTIDFAPEINVQTISHDLRQQGIVDIDAYRALGRNQLRIATFPAIELTDIQNLLKCIATYL